MKRTGEIILAIIGMIIYGIIALFGFLFIWMKNNPDLMEIAFDEVRRQGEMSAADIDLMMDVLGASGAFITIVSILAIVLGIVALILLKGNKSPVAAGIILIVVAVILSIITAGVAIIPGIFYFIAAIMCFVRKPAPPADAESPETQ